MLGSISNIKIVEGFATPDNHNFYRHYYLTINDIIIDLTHIINQQLLNIDVPLEYCLTCTGHRIDLETEDEIKTVEQMELMYKKFMNKNNRAKYWKDMTSRHTWLSQILQ